MDKIESMVEAVCGGGVLLTPFWLAYKLIEYILS